MPHSPHPAPPRARPFNPRPSRPPPPAATPWSDMPPSGTVLDPAYGSVPAAPPSGRRAG